MRILHVGKYYYPHLGGIETVTRDLSEGLVAHGHDVTVLCYSEDGRSDKETINGVHVERMSHMGVLASQPLSLSFVKRLIEIANDFDVIHLHSPNPLAELALGIMKLRGILVTTYHCDVVRQKWLLPFYRPFLKRALNKSQRIVAATQYHVEYSHTLKDYAHKCDIIPFGIREDALILNEQGQQLLEDNKNRFGSFLLFVGRLVPYKGLHILFEAMQHIEQKLVIVGRGPEKPALMAYAKELGIDDRIEFLGRVEDSNEFASLLHGCELLVLPSIDKSEAFGMSMVEAMACGKPVVSTSLESGVRFVNADGETGLQVPPNNAKLLAHAIGKLLSDDLMRSKMGKAARLRFESQFQSAEMINSYLALFESLSEQQKINDLRQVS